MARCFSSPLSRIWATFSLMFLVLLLYLMRSTAGAETEFDEKEVEGRVKEMLKELEDTGKQKAAQRAEESKSYGLPQLLGGQKPENQCQKDLLYSWNFRHKPWASSMYDAYGKMGSGLKEGNHFWFGDFDQCQTVEAPPSSQSMEGFYGVYAWLVFSYTGDWTSSMDLFSSAACIPSSCTDVQFFESFPLLIKTIDESHPGLASLLSAFQLINVRLIPRPSGISTEAKWCLVIVFSFVVLCLVGTYVDYELTNQVNEEDHMGFEELGHYNYKTGIIRKIPGKIRIKNGVGTQFLVCFSALRNFTSLFDITPSPGQMPCLHGIRFFSMTWVILEHVFINAITVTGDLKRGLTKMDTRFKQVIIEGQFSVDTFFLLSGFLLTHVYLKSNISTTFIYKWTYYYLHRIIRITPAFYMVLFFCSTLFQNLDFGPYWNYSDLVVGQCKNYWWTHVLFINNFYKESDECLPWMWYLPNDMQFYVFSPLLLVLLKRTPKRGLTLIWTLMVGFIVSTFVTAYAKNFSNTMVYLRELKFNPEAAQNSIKEMSATLYTQPTSRVGPYFIGMLLAYYLFQKSNRRVLIPRARLAFYWILAGGAAFFVIFGLFQVEASRSLYSIFHATSRHLWAAAVAWVVYACVTGNANAVNTLLSWKVFIPLSRLSYCTYLVHPIYVYWIYYGLRQPLYSNVFLLMVLYLGIIVLSFFTAFVLCILVESPFAKMEKLLLGIPGKTT